MNLSEQIIPYNFSLQPVCPMFGRFPVAEATRLEGMFFKPNMSLVQAITIFFLILDEYHDQLRICYNYSMKY